MIEEGLARQAHQIGVARGVLREKHDGPMMGGGARAWPRRLFGGKRKGEVQRAADDGLHALGRQRLGEFERAEEVVAVGDGERGLPVGRGELRQRLDRQRALQERVGGMDVKVNESGRRHRSRWGRFRVSLEHSARRRDSAGSFPNFPNDQHPRAACAGSKSGGARSRQRQRSGFHRIRTSE